MTCFLDLVSPQINDVGRLETTRWIGPQRVIYDHELLLVLDGECMTVFPDETIVSTPGTFIIKPSGVPHSASQTSHGKIQFAWVHFNWIYFPPPTNGSLFPCYAPGRPKEELFRPAPDFIPKGILHGAIPSPSAALHLFSCIYERWCFGTAKERAMCRVVFLELLIELLGERFDYFGRSVPTANGGHLANRIRETLNRMMDDPQRARLPLEKELANLGYSYPYLCRTFKKSFGVSPVSYLNSLRMERACQLLRNTMHPINEIAWQVGIPNPAYFTRLVIQHTGLTPRDYRRSNT